MKSNAVRHYDAKYAPEALGSEAPELALHPAPASRFEACLLGLPPRFRGGHVLEIGAGNGMLAQGLLDSGLPCESYTVSELSAVRLAGLRVRLRDPRVRATLLDVEEPAVEHCERYDAVILLALIEHLFDPLRAMRHIHGWLRPGGFAWIDTPNVAKWTRRLKLLAGRFPSTASQEEGLVTYDGEPADLHDEGHLHYFTYRSLTRMLVERCGFSRVEKVPYATGPRLLGRRADYALARAWPEMFGELGLVAWR
jgi:SAM-dependent methyltransferase